MAFTQPKTTSTLALEAFRITVASYGIAFLRMFKLQHVSLILRKSLQILSKESRMKTGNPENHLKPERKIVHTAPWKTRPCLKGHLV